MVIQYLANVGTRMIYGSLLYLILIVRLGDFEPGHNVCQTWSAKTIWHPQVLLNKWKLGMLLL